MLTRGFSVAYLVRRRYHHLAEKIGDRKTKCGGVNITRTANQPASHLRHTLPDPALMARQTPTRAPGEGLPGAEIWKSRPVGTKKGDTAHARSGSGACEKVTCGLHGMAGAGAGASYKADRIGRQQGKRGRARTWRRPRFSRDRKERGDYTRGPLASIWLGQHSSGQRCSGSATRSLANVGSQLERGFVVSQCHRLHTWGVILRSLKYSSSWAMCWQNIVVEGRVESSREGRRGRTPGAT